MSIECLQTEEFETHISTYTMIGISYTKSIFPDIRASAALFVGMLLHDHSSTYYL